MKKDDKQFKTLSKHSKDSIDRLCLPIPSFISPTLNLHYNTGCAISNLLFQNLIFKNYIVDNKNKSSQSSRYLIIVDISQKN